MREGVRAVTVAGELDLAVAPRLQGALDELPGDCETALIELQDCEFIDSIGIAVLVRSHLRFLEAGRRLVVCAPRAQVRRVLEMAGVTERGLVFDSVGQALS